MNTSPARIRTLVFIISGLMDLFFGVILLLSWLNLLPLNLAGFGLTHRVTGLLGAVLSVSGVMVVVYQVTKLREPEE